MNERQHEEMMKVLKEIRNKLQNMLDARYKREEAEAKRRRGW